MDGMKLLIAYDGSANADAALASLRRAGMPRRADVLVLTISEVWISSSIEAQLDDEMGDVDIAVEGRAVAALRKARRLAEGARTQLLQWFPHWDIRVEAHSDAPAFGILERIGDWMPDMVVVGTHGRSLIGRMFLGSVSQKVLAEADCSVHIGRRTRHPEDPVQIVVGIDGSRDAQAAIAEIASRTWPRRTDVHLVSAYTPIDSRYSESTPRFSSGEYSAGHDSLTAVRMLIEDAAATLERAGLKVTRSIRAGVPVAVLLDEAEVWDADLIVLGARGHRMMERLFLGSVSSAVAVRASCSVEVIRPWTGPSGRTRSTAR